MPLLPNQGNGMFCAEGMTESNEVCEECHELLDECQCDEYMCDECGEDEEDCECDEDEDD